MYKEQRAKVDLMRKNTNNKKKSSTASNIKKSSNASHSSIQSQPTIGRGNNNMIQVGIVNNFYLPLFHQNLLSQVRRE